MMTIEQFLCAMDISLPQKQLRELRAMFSKFPKECLWSLRLVQKQGGQSLIRLEDPSDLVFLLLEGTVTCLTPMSSGLQYQYATFQAPFFLGELEAFSSCPYYRSTVICATPCTLLSIPKQTYLYWMQHDAQQLYQRTCAITTNLGAQARMEREKLFSSGLQRLAVYLLTHGRQEKQGGPYTLRQTVQDMADGIGSSTKTVQRSLAKLVSLGAIVRTRSVLYFDQAQYQQLLTIGCPEAAFHPPHP